MIYASSDTSTLLIPKHGTPEDVKDLVLTNNCTGIVVTLSREDGDFAVGTSLALYYTIKLLDSMPLSAGTYTYQLRNTDSQPIEAGLMSFNLTEEDTTTSYEAEQEDIHEYNG